jgi:hypothetical protein
MNGDQHIAKQPLSSLFAVCTRAQLSEFSGTNHRKVVDLYALHVLVRVAVWERF